jgi:hypothetical protein
MFFNNASLKRLTNLEVCKAFLDKILRGPIFLNKHFINTITNTC